MSEIEFIKDKIRQLLPPGPAWELEAGTTKEALIEAIADIYARIYQRTSILIRDSNPLYAAEMFESREAEAALPDPCWGGDATMLERHEGLIHRWRSRGGQSPAYYKALAESIGFSIEVEEYRHFQAGASHAGDKVSNDSWNHAWAVIASNEHIKDIMVAGFGSAGDPLKKWGNEMLECMIERYKPAHTTVLYKYM